MTFNEYWEEAQHHVNAEYPAALEIWKVAQQEFNKLRDDRKHVRYLLQLAYWKLYNAKFSLKDPALMSAIEKYLQNTGD